MRNVIVILAVCLAACSAGHRGQDRAELARQVTETERAFAKTMAERDSTAFASFVSDEAVFFSGPAPLRGKRGVTGYWRRFFEKPEAPFSWDPERVEVLDSGTLALSTGPVYDPRGRKTATFTSVWRREAPGVWRIVFDTGNEVCDPSGR
jgi:ketosteroid isomerase-like protein